MAATPTRKKNSRRKANRSSTRVVQRRITSPLAIHSQPVGVGGTAIISGRVANEEYNADLENEKSYGDWSKAGVFEKMRRSDPQIRQMLKLLKLPILAAEWTVTPGEDSPIGREVADFVAWNLFERLRWKDLLRQILTYKDFGFSLFEILEAMVPVPDGRFPGLNGSRAFVWDAWEPRLPRTVYQWVPSKRRPTQLEKVVQLAGYTDGESSGFREILAHNLLRFTNEQEGSNFEGFSELRPAYKPWFLKTMLEKLDAIRHERQNVGIAKITLPEDSGEEEIEKAEDILEALNSQAKSYIVLPAGWEFEWDCSGEGKGTEVGVRIEALDREIAAGSLTGFMSMDKGDTGSYALAETLADQYLLQEECEFHFVEEVVNKGSDGTSHVRRLVEMNYGAGAPVPWVCAKNRRTRDFVQILPLIIQAIQSGGLTKTPDVENRIREMTLLDTLDPAVLEAYQRSSAPQPEPMEAQEDAA